MIFVSDSTTGGEDRNTLAPMPCFNSATLVIGLDGSELDASMDFLEPKAVLSLTVSRTGSGFPSVSPRVSLLTLEVIIAEVPIP